MAPARSALDEIRYRYCAFGVTVGVVLTADTETEVRRRVAVGSWSEQRTLQDGPRVCLERRGDAYVVSGLAEQAVVFTDIKRAAADVVDRLEMVIATTTRQVVFLHAGAIARGGRALVLPGRTRTGKSTLVHALVSEGFDYLSDEYAVLDRNGFVHPFPRRISLRDDAPRTWLDGRMTTAGEPQMLDAVVFSEFVRGSVPDFRPLSAAAAVLRLLQHAHAARTQPDIVFPLIAAVARSSRVFEGHRGEALEGARELSRLLRLEGL